MSAIPRCLGTPLPLLKGEEVKEQFKDLSYLCPYSGSIKGTLILTNYRIYFKSDETADSTEAPTVLDMPLGFISKVDKMGGRKEAELRGEKFYGLEMVCKDVRTLRFMMSKAHEQSAAALGSRSDIVEAIRTLAFPKEAKQFAGLYSDVFPVCGWSVYDPQNEYTRQKVGQNGWKVVQWNAKWEICPTYPQVLVVPNEVTKDDLEQVAAFRSKGRIPVLSWIRHTGDTQGAAICRCSQPLKGPKSARSNADERMVQKILAANAGSNRICIYDARPKRNAMANVLVGGGFEDVDDYEDMELGFLEIHNIHVMRESLRKVKELCFPNVDDKKLLTNIENTQWLQNLSCILSGAIEIAKKIDQGLSVIVHCSDGWDRTAQLTSLSMLMLDPYYRTLEGFIVLIEKEWLSFGHKFAHRNGHFEDTHNSNDRSPIFLQFIDCVWQVTRQFPFLFEFNEEFLIHVLDHLYSCLFGTFLYNSERERVEHGVRNKTHSLWSYVMREKKLFVNTSFRPDHTNVILPKADTCYFLLWKTYFCRWNPVVGTPDAKAHRKNDAKQRGLRQSLMSVRASLLKELDSKNKGKSEATSDDAAVQGIAYRSTASAPVVLSPTASTASSSGGTTSSSSGSSGQPPPTSPPSINIASSLTNSQPQYQSPATNAYYHNMTSTAATSGAVLPPPLPARGGGVGSSAPVPPGRDARRH